MKTALLDRADAMLTALEETIVLHGDDSYAGLDAFLRMHNCCKIAVFTGRYSADASGAWNKLLAGLRFVHAGVVRFKDIPAEPDMECVHNMTDFLRRNDPDCVIALGGGSVMDAAKAAYIVYQSNMQLVDCFGSNRISDKFPGREFKRIIAIPTTSGTGSELTQYSNIVNRTGNVKQLISDPVLVPAVAVLDGKLTCSMPYDVTLATGCDAMAHLLEGWLNVNMDTENGLIDQAAALGVELLLENLPVVLSEPENHSARKAVQLAAALGGLTIRNKSTGLPHLLSFSWFGRIEHGIAVARLLPAAWRYYIERKEVAIRSLEIGKVFGGNTPEEVIAAYEKFLDKLGVKELSEYEALDEALKEQTCRSAGANRMKLELAPRPVPLEESEEILRNILNEAWKRK